MGLIRAQALRDERRGLASDLPHGTQHLDWSRGALFVYRLYTELPSQQHRLNSSDRGDL